MVKACKNPEFQLEIGKEVIAVDKKYYRPTEVDPADWRILPKLKHNSAGNPKYDLPALVREMMSNDVELFKKKRN